MFLFYFRMIQALISTIQRMRVASRYLKPFDLHHSHHHVKEWINWQLSFSLGTMYVNVCYFYVKHLGA